MQTCEMAMITLLSRFDIDLLYHISQKHFLLMAAELDVSTQEIIKGSFILGI